MTTILEQISGWHYKFRSHPELDSGSVLSNDRPWTDFKVTIDFIRQLELVYYWRYPILPSFRSSQ